MVDDAGRGRSGGAAHAVPVRRVMTTPVVTAHADESCRAVAERMREHRISSLVVLDGGAHGIVTDRDLCNRLVAAGGSSDDPVRTIASFPARTIGADTLAFEALLEMLAQGTHHFPVAEGGRIVGMLSSGDLLRLQGSSPTVLRQRIDAAASVEEVRDVVAGVPAAVGDLLATGATGSAMGRLVAVLTDRVVLRLRDLVTAGLAREGRGESPAPYGWLAFGSHGRREQTLHTDQDTGLLLPDGLDDAALAWFAALGQRMTDALEVCGFARCGGGVMASEPRWRLDLGGWRSRFAGWIDAPSIDNLLGVDIAFDVRTVAGDLDARELLGDVIARSAGNQVFLARLAREAVSRRPPLGLLGRLQVERSGPRQGTLDVKARVMLPIADLARVHTLARGGDEVGTVERLAAARADRLLSDELGAVLAAGYDLALRLRLAGQLERLAAGEEPDNRIDPGALAPFERGQLRETCKAVRTVQDALGTAYLTHLLG